jgi:hypothetical protein
MRPAFATVGRGALAGLLGSAAMHVFRIGWEAIACRSSRDGIFGFDHEADVRSGYVVSSWLSGRHLSEKQAAKIGLAMHYGYGTLLGASYASLWDKESEWCRAAPDALLAVGLWLAGDEIPLHLAGISDPFARPLRSHAGALAVHLLFVATLKNTLRVHLTSNSGDQIDCKRR